MSVKSGAMGLWETDREQLTQTLVDGTGLYSSLDDLLDFKTQALRLVASELSCEKDDSPLPVYFVFANKEVFAQAVPHCERVPMLRSPQLRSRSIYGNLWFVPRAVNLGFAINTEDKTPEEVFKLIEQFGADARPTVIFDPQSETNIADIFPEGISSPYDSDTVDLSSKPVGVIDILAALDGLYQLIRSPDQTTAAPLWEDSNSWRPIRQAEATIQVQVIWALAGKFSPMIDIRSEQPSTIGRTDVELVQTWGLPSGDTIQHALIELKVLRSYGSTGKAVSDKIIIRHITQGVRQAAQYGSKKHSKIRMLCCYDMRKKDIGDNVCFKDFFKPAADRNVELKRYFLYNSSKALRKALDAEDVIAGASPLPE